jgi:hypothetical protein
MSKKNEGERTVASDEVVEAAERELGSERSKAKHEVRPDGSIAYFEELTADELDRERAAAGIPPRETGTTKETR